MDITKYIDSIVELHFSIGIKALYKRNGDPEYNAVADLILQFVEKNFPTSISTRCTPGLLRYKPIYDELTKYVQEHYPKVLNSS